jgi:hypothetical protein
MLPMVSYMPPRRTLKYSPWTLSARSHIMSVLETGVTRGELVIVDAGGRAVFGSPKKGREPIVLVVTDERLWTRMLASVNFSIFP